MRDGPVIAEEKERCIVMGLEEAQREEEEKSIIGKLALFSMRERSGMATPPFETSAAAVPFRWEQVPGKPRPCTALITFSNPTDLLPKCLQLPPSRLLLPSPSTTTLFNSNTFGSPSFSVSSNCYGNSKYYASSFCSWKKKTFKLKKAEVKGGTSYVFPSSTHNNDTAIVLDSSNITSMKRSSTSFTLYHTNSRVWTSICEGLKQVVPWKSKKLKKNGSGIRL